QDESPYRVASLGGVTFRPHLVLAERLGIRATTVAYPMTAASGALSDLAHGRFSGAAVLHNG
ncbi:MAG: hypothetical protein WKF51_10650, partial [Geodermatophilaceae bacterium]